MSEEQETYKTAETRISISPEVWAILTGALGQDAGAGEPEAAETTPDPLQEYTQAWLDLQRFREANSLLIATLETLEGMVAEAEATLRADARELGPMRNEIIEVLVQQKVSRSYDGALLLERAPWLEAAGACKKTIDVDAKKIDTLVKKGMLAEEALAGVITEKLLTPAVTIRPVGIRG